MTKPRAMLRVAPARSDERWRPAGFRRRQLSTFAVAVVAGSLILHACVLALVLLAVPPTEAAPPQEIPVEVVQEMPPAQPPKPAPAPQAAEAPKPMAPKPPPPAVDAQRAELEHQLDELKAEQRELQNEKEDLGPLRDSIHAVALPSAGGDDDAGELVGYKSLVFSQLAKAKDGAKEAAKPATVGVRFSVNDDGVLVDVAVVVSSGVANLDAESLAIVRRAAPFPKPPAGAERSFSANFAYAGPGR